KGQLGAATAALDELGLGQQPVASLAKREEEIYVPGKEEPLRLPRSSPILQLVQRVRDEAHRFAIGFHRKTRDKRTLRSELDDIPGVGPEGRRRRRPRERLVRKEVAVASAGHHGPLLQVLQDLPRGVGARAAGDARAGV